MDDDENEDPRKDEDWKLQKRRGFLKDREEKIKSSKQAKQTKQTRQSKTAR